MGILETNIEHYMKLKGIERHSQLLIKIAYELGIKGNEAYKFAEREKSNFSKMLKEERPLKRDFIIPLEKIFGISLARLLYEEAYKMPVEKKDVPFIKGFRYYAYKDDPKLYREELSLLTAKNGRDIIEKTDEFGNNFLDYVVEYNSVNGIRYLREEYGIKIKWYDGRFELEKYAGGFVCIQHKNLVALARLVASMDDAELFNDIFDSYNMFFTNGHYASEKTIFCLGEYLEILLDNEALFKSIFEIKEYESVCTLSEKRKKGVGSVTYSCINPIINNCLRYALEHIDKYKHRATDILKFGIEYNRKKATEISFEDCYVCNELGGIKNYKDEDFYDIIIFVDTEVSDEDIKELTEQLIKFNNR